MTISIRQLLKKDVYKHVKISFEELFSFLGLVPEPASKMEEAAKVELVAAFPVSADAFTLPSTSGRHHLLLALLGAQWILRWLFTIPSLYLRELVAIFWDR